MKICLISHSFLPSIGGSQLAVHHLSKTLTKMGHDVYVLTHYKNTKRDLQLNYNLLFYPRVPKELLQPQVTAFYLLYINKRYKFDIIHIHVAKICHFILKIKKFLKIPIVITTHGGDIQRYPEINYGLRLDPGLNKNIEYSIRHADLVTAIGSSTHQDYIDIGVAEHKIVDIPNGVDLNRFHNKKPDIRAKLGLRRDAKLLLSVGRYHPKKGYEYLIRAMPEILKHHKQVKCLLVGKRLEILQPLVDELSLNDAVIFIKEQGIEARHHTTAEIIDNFPNAYLMAIYKSCDIYVSAALIEGFALTVIEAMAAGLPLVATDVPGNEDAVADGTNGFLTPPKNPVILAAKINQLLQDHELREKMGGTSKNMAQQYDWPLIAAAYHRQYQKLIISQRNNV